MLKDKKKAIIYLLLSGLAIHDFFTIEDFKIFGITVTYLRIVLAISIILLFFARKEIKKHDNILTVFVIFMIYGFTRISGNYKEFFNIYTVLVSFIILYALIDNNKTIEKCIHLLATFLIIFTLYGLFEIITGFHLVQTYFGDDNVKLLATGMYFNENDFSAYLSILIFYMLLSKYNKYTKVIFVGIAISIIIINKSLICLLGIVSFFLLYWLLKDRENNTRLKRGIFTILGIAIAINPITTMLKGSSWYWRLYMYKKGLLNCANHFVLGTGIGNYEKGMYSVGYIDYLYASPNPHCTYLELAGEFGIIWAILLIIIIVKLLNWYRKRLNKTNIYYFGIVYMFSFVCIASSSSLEKNYMYLALLFPLLYYKCNSIGCENNDKKNR